MGFIDSIRCEIGEGFDLLPFRAVLFGDRSVYIENVKSIKSYSKEKIELCLKRGYVVITGEELSIKKYCLGDLAICGKIKGFSIN